MIPMVTTTSTPSKRTKIMSALIVALIIVSFLWLSMFLIGYKLDFATLLPFKQRLWQGFSATLIISVMSLLISLFIGAMTAIGQKSKVLVISYLAQAYVQIIRGTPLLVQIYFFFYIVGTAWGITNRNVAGALILSIFEGAYISEIIRGGLESIDRQQYEIAKAIGLSPAKTSRLVTFPILMSRILPALSGQFASIIKDSSLLSVIAVNELTQNTQEISSQNFRMFENYFFLGLLYFAMSFTVSMITRWLERVYKHADNT